MDIPHLEAVASSNLAAVGYDGHLYVQFRNGSLYRYFHVPFSVYRGLMMAPSHGRYFNWYIRRRYATQLVRGIAVSKI